MLKIALVYYFSTQFHPPGLLIKICLGFLDVASRGPFFLTMSPKLRYYYVFSFDNLGFPLCCILVPSGLNADTRGVKPNCCCWNSYEQGSQKYVCVIDHY